MTPGTRAEASTVVQHVIKTDCALCKRDIKLQWLCSAVQTAATPENQANITAIVQQVIEIWMALAQDESFPRPETHAEKGALKQTDYELQNYARRDPQNPVRLVQTAESPIHPRAAQRCAKRPAAMCSSAALRCAAASCRTPASPSSIWFSVP